MNVLAQTLQSQGLTGTSAEIVAALTVEHELPHVDDLWSYSGVAAKYGESAAEGIAAAMTAAGLTTGVIVYATRGFDLSIDKTRGQLDAIAVDVPSLAGVCKDLKAIGRPTIPLWQHAGLSALPSEEEIAVAQAEITNQQALATFINECVNPAVAADGATVSSIKSAVAAWGK